MAAGKLPPIYDRAALKLTDATARAMGSRRPQAPLAFQALSRNKVSWSDLVRGPVEIDTATMSDPVLVREDGAFLYTLPSVADDMDFAISHVVRGEDHVTNTAPRSRFSRRWARPCRASRISRCWWARAARRCPSGWVRCRWNSLRADGIEPMAVDVLSRQASAPPMRSSRADSGGIGRGNSISPRSAGRRRISSLRNCRR